MYRTILLAGLLSAALAAPAIAQVPTDTAAVLEQLRRELGTGQLSPDDIRARIEAAGLTLDDVRERLRRAGYPANLLDSYLTGVPSAGGPTLTPSQLEQVMRRLSVPPLPDTLAFDSLMALDTLLMDTTLLAVPEDEPRVYGRDIFERATTQFQPLTMGPVPSNYRLGPGDELVLILTGDVQEIYTLPVTREGFVVIPNVGRVSVNGMSLQGLREALYTYLGRVYSGVRPGPEATTHFEVSIASLRRNQVYVIGDVERPSAYEVSSVSTVMDALYQAGGPSENGSFRNIQVRRGNRVIAVLDMYEYLSQGAAEGDISLDQGDVVFVPVRGRRVHVEGDVIRPGIYELKGDEGLRGLIELAGGIEPEADLRRVQIDRILPPDRRQPGMARTLMDVNVAEVLDEEGALIPLEPGDRVYVFAVPEERRNTVAVRGNVWKPGIYSYAEGMTVTELIDRAGGLKDDTYLGRAQIVRLDPRDLSQRVIPVALAGDTETPLQEYDELVVYSVAEFRDRRYVVIHGAVQNPGVYDFHESMTLRDLVMRAGGLRDDAYVLQAEVARLGAQPDETGDMTRIHTVPLDSSYVISEYTRRGDGGGGARPGGGGADGSGSKGRNGADGGAMQPSPDFELLRYDNIFIRQRPGWELQRTVIVDGEIQFPGMYALHSRDERLSEVLERAGGLTAEAYPAGIRFFRRQENPRPGQDTITRVNVDLPAVLQDVGRDENIILQDGDSIFIPQFTPTVRVEGAVLFPVSVLYEPGADFDYYIGSAGGYARDADPGRGRVEYPNGSIRTVDRWLFFRSTPRPEPGSRIFVPVKPEGQGTDWGSVIRDGLAIITGFATVYALLERAN